jgi:hypothetical protein
MRIDSGLTRAVMQARGEDPVTRRDAATSADAVRRLPGRLARSLRDLRDGFRDWRVLVGVAVRSVRYGLYDPMTPTDLTPGVPDISPAGPMVPIDPMDPHAAPVARLDGARERRAPRHGGGERAPMALVRDRAVRSDPGSPRTRAR